MTELERIADQLKRSFYGEAWSGPAVKEVLIGVTAGMASQRPIPDAHTIWELVHHIAAWANIARRRVNGEAFTVTPEVNFPPVEEPTEAAWHEALQSLDTAEEELRKTISGLSEARLDEAPMAGGVSVYVLLHGVVQHSLYHAGQIALLKKAIVDK